MYKEFVNNFVAVFYWRNISVTSNITRKDEITIYYELLMGDIILDY